MQHLWTAHWSSNYLQSKGPWEGKGEMVLSLTETGLLRERRSAAWLGGGRGCRNGKKKNLECPIRPTMAAGG